MVERGVFGHFTQFAMPAGRAFACDTRRIETNLYWLKAFSSAARRAAIERAAERSTAAESLGDRDYLLSCLRELIFESVRIEVAPALPSRSSCVFAFDMAADPARVAERFGFDPAARRLLEIRPDRGCVIHRGDASALDTSPIAADIVAAAHRYWRRDGGSVAREDAEILLAGPFQARLVADCCPRITIEGQGFADVFATLHDEPERSDAA